MRAVPFVVFSFAIRREGASLGDFTLHVRKLLHAVVRLSDSDGDGSKRELVLVLLRRR